MSFIDPIAAVQQSEREARMPFIAPEEFWIDYVPQDDGTMKAVEWVRWVKKGQQNPTTVPEKISRLSKNPDNPIWQVLKPYYEAWKAGQEAPTNGTALAAWPGSTPQLVKALLTCNIKTVEDLAGMEDSAMQRLAVPGLRDKQKLARAWLQAQSSIGDSVAVKKTQEDNENLRREVAELRALIEQHAIKEPKKRGRPPKVVEE